MFFRRKNNDELELLRLRITQLEAILGEQQRTVDTLLRRASSSSAVLKNSSSANFDEFYIAFEDQFRGKRDDIKERFKVYLPYLHMLRGLHPDPLLLDVGCGRGEWLELAVEEGYVARGVDSNCVAITECMQLGFDVIKADVIEYLSAKEAASVSCITGFHILEHLPPDLLISFFHEAYRVLEPGGLLIAETPDPENITVSCQTFYYDPTHRNPLPDVTLAFIAEYAGFARLEILKQHKLADTEPTGNLQLDDIIRRFYMTQDYTIVAWKP